MSARIEAWAWKQKLGNPLRKMIFAKLANAADEQGWLWWSQAGIARECEISRSTVIEHLNALRGLGLVQTVRANLPEGRGRASNYWRVMAPWIDAEVADPPERPGRVVNVVHSDVGRPDTNSKKGFSEQSEEQDPALPSPEFLGQRRWRVFSRPGRGPFIANLDRSTCTCENRSASICRHLRVAKAAEEARQAAGRRERRDAVWDVLVEIFGAPTSRQKGARGGAVTDLAEMLTAEKVPADGWQEEIRRRYEALAKDWGIAKVTLHSFVANFGVARNVLRGGRVGDNNGESDAFDRYD